MAKYHLEKLIDMQDEKIKELTDALNKANWKLSHDHLSDENEKEHALRKMYSVFDLVVGTQVRWRGQFFEVSSISKDKMTITLKSTGE
jgi:hypothetical protein